MSEPVIRPARPSDHERIVGVVDRWWGRPVHTALPRLFLDHFFATSRIAERDGVLAGFLVGFCSPSIPDEAYVHFLGVAPTERGRGLGARLYREFFEIARADHRTVVRAVTSPVNTASIAFHRRMGFRVSPPDTDTSATDVNGSETRVRFTLVLPG